MDNSFDPDKDAANREKHGLSLSFGGEIFKDDAHLILPTIRPEDGEERFKVVGRNRIVSGRSPRGGVD